MHAAGKRTQKIKIKTTSTSGSSNKINPSILKQTKNSGCTASQFHNPYTLRPVFSFLWHHHFKKLEHKCSTTSRYPNSQSAPPTTPKTKKATTRSCSIHRKSENPKIASRMISKGAEKEKYFVMKREASNRANAFLSRAQSSEILRGLRHYISKELYNQTPFQVASYAYVHKHPWICHRSKNKHQTPPVFLPSHSPHRIFSSLHFPSLPKFPRSFYLALSLLVHKTHQAQYKRSRKNNNNNNTTTTTTNNNENNNNNNNLCFFPRNRVQKKSENDNRTKSEDGSKSGSLNK